MVPVMVVVFNELSDRLLELPRIVVVLQFDSVVAWIGAEMEFAFPKP